MSNSLQFDSRVVLIAGDAGATGNRVAETFIAAGARVILCGPQRPASLPGTQLERAAEFTAVNDDPEQIAAAVAAVAENHGRLDVLVTITGTAPAAGAASPDVAQRGIRDGLLTPLHFNQAANRRMQQQSGGGSIINISCTHPPPASAEPAVQAAATAGLINLGASLAVEWAPRVRVNTVTAGLTQTEHPGWSASAGQLPRLDRSCLFLASALASYISGTHIAAAAAP